jgi:DNA-binding NarL/FixJ family response regulator
MRERPDYTAYVTERSPRLLRTAYLLCRDWGQAEDKAVLWEALGRLPHGQRSVVVLRYFEDLSEPQAAAILGCSVGTVKSQASKALAKLRVDPGILADAQQGRDERCRTA